MRRNRLAVGIIVFLVMLTGFTGCSKNEKSFLIVTTKAMMTGVKGQIETARFEIYESGRLEITKVFTGSETEEETVVLDSDDLKLLKAFVKESIENDTYADTHVNATDGQTWTFTYIDSEKNEKEIYSGYVYGIDELENIRYILASYLPELYK